MNVENKNEIISKFQSQGVKILDPNTTYIDDTVVIEENVTIYPNTFIEGNSILHSGCTIGVNSKLNNAVIGSNTTIESSYIINSIVGDNTTIGPMSHIREHCIIGSNVRIGNFVEMKKTVFGNGSKCAHLTYLGDSEVGECVNIGCGVVTVNYDGKNKSKTVIGNRAFIGSNANLIAPIKIGDYAVVAAGSTCDKDVHSDDMAIARARQITKEGYGKKYINK